MALDLHSPWGRRWAWWWLHRDIFGRPACARCGYPNLGEAAGNCFELEFEATECIVCGYPDFGTGFGDEDMPDDMPHVFHAGGVWRHPDEWDFPEADEPEAGRAVEQAKMERRSLSRYENRLAGFSACPVIPLSNFVSRAHVIHVRSREVATMLPMLRAILPDNPDFSFGAGASGQCMQESSVAPQPGTQHVTATGRRETPFLAPLVA